MPTTFSVKKSLNIAPNSPKVGQRSCWNTESRHRFHRIDFPSFLGLFTYRYSSSGLPVFCAYTWGHPPWSFRSGLKCRRRVTSSLAPPHPTSPPSVPLPSFSTPPPSPAPGLRHTIRFTTSPSQTPQPHGPSYWSHVSLSALPPTFSPPAAQPYKSRLLFGVVCKK